MSKRILCWKKVENYYVVICKDKKDKFKYYIKDNFTVDKSKSVKISEDEFMIEFMTNVDKYTLFSDDCNISKRFNDVINSNN